MMIKKLKINNCAGLITVRLKLIFKAENSLENTKNIAKYNQNEFWRKTGNTMEVIPVYSMIIHRYIISSKKSKGQVFNLGRVCFKMYRPSNEKHPAIIVTR